jgi:hypothetical protein
MSALVLQAPPEEVMEIAAAVLGGPPLPDGHSGRADALTAMNALGYCTTYMAEQLGVPATVVYRMARKLGISLDRGRGVVDRVAVDMVVPGVPLRLRGQDLQAALVELAAAGKTATECGRLLCADPSVVARLATEIGVRLGVSASEGCWWSVYTDDRKRRPAG